MPATVNTRRCLLNNFKIKSRQHRSSELMEARRRSDSGYADGLNRFHALTTTPQMKSLHSNARLICLMLLTSLSAASGQLAPVRRMPLAEHVERYYNPPAPPRKVETGPPRTILPVWRVYQLSGERRCKSIRTSLGTPRMSRIFG